MNLSERTRATAKAAPATDRFRYPLGIAGVLMVMWGLTYANVWTAVAGAFLAGGWILTRSDERFYLEGFADGAELGEQLAAAAAAAEAYGSHDARSNGTVRGGPRADVELSADAGADPDQRVDAAAGAVDYGVIAARQARARVPAPRLLDEDARPIPRPGPRPADYPIAAAVATGSPGSIEQDGTTARRATDFGVGSRSGS